MEATVVSAVVVAACYSVRVHRGNRYVVPGHHTADALLHPPAAPRHQQSPRRVQRRILHHDRGQRLVRRRCCLYLDEVLLRYLVVISIIISGYDSSDYERKVVQ